MNKGIFCSNCGALLHLCNCSRSKALKKIMENLTEINNKEAALK